MRTAKNVYRPAVQRAVQNGPVVKRRRADAPSRTQQTLQAVRQRAQPQRRHRQQNVPEVPPAGLSVFGTLIGAGSFIALLLVVALQWQRNAYQFNQNEVTLRSALDTVGDQRQRIEVEQLRALSPQENELRSRSTGLAPLKLDERVATVKLATAKREDREPGKRRTGETERKRETESGRQPTAQRSSSRALQQGH